MFLITNDGAFIRLNGLVKIENGSRKRSHKLDGIGVGKVRTFPFLPIPFTSLPFLIL